MKRAKSTNKFTRFKLPRVKIPSDTQKSFPIPKDEIDALREKSKERLLFSFRFFDRYHKAFSLGGVTLSWHISLLDILKEVSNISRHELVVEQRNYYEAHGHEWDELKYCYDFTPEFLEQVECMQFRISQSRGRVHGFIIGNRFYIVWIDPHHNLYPDERFGPEKIYEPQLNCYDILLCEHEKLKQEFSEVWMLLENQTS